MLIKMRGSKGFTLVELMIIMAIIGILAAFVVPFYQNYIQKSRILSLVMPGVHSIETNIATHLSLKKTWPADDADIQVTDEIGNDADMRYFNAAWNQAARRLTITLKNQSGENKFSSALLNIDGTGASLVLTAEIGTDNTIIKWTMGGKIAEQLGLDDE
jgi:prepilin-type N-terminal cleavage/methylation domain-containing protein